MSTYRSSRQTPPLTWDTLTSLEPGLAALLKEVKQVKDPGPSLKRQFCANDVWYDQIKPRMERLVGWERGDKHPVLATRSAYDLAYHALYDPLPACRNCICA